ncbi:replication initiator [Oryzihumus sp.]
MLAPDGAPVTTDMARALAEHEGVCIRPVLRRVTDRATGDTTTVPIPCGSTREKVCAPCAAKARRLRMHQCLEGWHLTEDPTPGQSPEDDVTEDPDDTDEESPDPNVSDRRSRSTRRRQDTPDLPRAPMDQRTTGRSFTTPEGKTYQPSMFLTLTLPSYGKVIPGTGVPVNPETYDYRRAALDALHFAKLVDRFWQNLRRCAGYKVQYFSAIEAQRRLVAHLHAALRGAIPRATLKAVTRATYHQLWWPSFDEPVYTERLPVWDPATGDYRDPDTGIALRTWGQALDDLDADPDAKPAHVVRFGKQVDIKGLLGGTLDSDRAVRYLCKYLTKSVADTWTGTKDTEPDPAYEAHIDRLHEHVRWLPCTPTCANWLRYGIQPDEPGPGLVPGHCTGKAHERDNLGLGGRRVLVSRQWSGKTLTQHRVDRAEVVRQVLSAAGIEAPEARRCAADVLDTDGLPRFVWEDTPATERDYTAAVITSIRQARRWRAQYQHAKTIRDGSDPPVETNSATNQPATDPAA